MITTLNRLADGILQKVAPKVVAQAMPCATYYQYRCGNACGSRGFRITQRRSCRECTGDGSGCGAWSSIGCDC